MTVAQLTSARSLLRSVLRSAICVTGFLAVTVLPGFNSKAQIKQPNQASSGVSQKQTASRSPVPKRENEITIVPKIDVHVSAQHLWADGQTPAVLSISLYAVKGNETWAYS